MVVILTGVPGSGKTYKAVYAIYNSFSDSPKVKKELKKDYENFYTNINGFNFQEIDKGIKLDFDELYKHLKELHNIYKDNKKSDNVDELLIEKCKELDIYKSLFIIDECHNEFDKYDAVLVWWLSYHRHLFHDIYLITQNLSLVHSKYKSFSEYFLKAKPNTINITNKSLKYDYFINSRMAQNGKTQTEKLPKLKEVFALYHSGDSVKSKNFLLTYYIFAFSMIVIFILVAYFYFGNFDDKESKKSNTVSHSAFPIAQTKPLDTDDDSIDYKDNRLYLFTCTSMFCNYENNSYPMPLIRLFLKQKKMEEVYIYHNQGIVYRYLSSSPDFINFLTNLKGVQDENFNAISIIP